MRVALALLLLLTAPALGYDRGQYNDVSPDIRAWVNGLTDANGMGCCAASEGVPPDEVQWDTAGDHYRVRIGGTWIDVPETALITKPNRLGRAVAWIWWRDGKPVVRCFLPGDGT